MSSLPTASSWERCEACPAAAVLPQVASDSSESADGVAVHAQVLDAGPARRDGIALSEIPPGNHERAWEYDLATGQARCLGRLASPRAYPHRPGCLYGTSDIDGHNTLYDIKAGPRADDVTGPDRNLQIRGLALFKARAETLDSIVVGLVRIGMSGHVQPEAVRMDGADLMETEARLHAMVAAIEAVPRDRVPDVVEGRHCRYCPAFAACPAKTALVRRLATDPATLEDELRRLSAVDLRTAYERYRIARDVVGRIGETFHGIGAQRTIDIGDGRVFGAHDVERDAIDGAVAFAAMSERHGLEAAMAAVEMRGTKAGIKRGLKAAGVKPLAAAEREVLAVITQRGGLETKTQTRVEEYRVENRDAEPRSSLSVVASG